jgi:hypothetical protein
MVFSIFRGFFLPKITFIVRNNKKESLYSPTASINLFIPAIFIALLML